MEFNFGAPANKNQNGERVEELNPQETIVENVCDSPSEEVSDNAPSEVPGCDAPGNDAPSVASECEVASTAEAAPCNDAETQCEQQSCQCAEQQPVAASAEITELKELILGLSAKLADIETRLVAKIEEDNQKNSLFDRMYNELAQHKKGLYASIMKPFINETVSLTGDYERLVDQLDSIDHDKLVRYVKNIPSDLEDMLENNGVERYSDDTEKFNPKTQRVMKTIETDDPAKDNVIAEHIRKGYRWDGQMLKPELVAIYKYKKPQA